MFAWLSTGRLRTTLHRTQGIRGQCPALAQSEDFPIGSHLVTPRLGFTHHGIYVGDGRVVHYGSITRCVPGGPVEEASLERFAQRHPVSVRTRPASRVEGEEVARRARSRVGENAYRLFSNNCEHFCEWCLHGQQRSYQVEHVLFIPLLRRIGASLRERLRPGSALLARE